MHWSIWYIFMIKLCLEFTVLTAYFWIGLYWCGLICWSILNGYERCTGRFWKNNWYINKHWQKHNYLNFLMMLFPTANQLTQYVARACLLVSTLPWIKHEQWQWCMLCLSVSMWLQSSLMVDSCTLQGFGMRNGVWWIGLDQMFKDRFGMTAMKARKDWLTVVRKGHFCKTIVVHSCDIDHDQVATYWSATNREVSMKR